MQNRHRRMYQLTGLPGWMRFGYSPGWQGRSPSGLGPCAQYLMQGTWPTPQMNSIWGGGQVPSPPGEGFPMPGFATPYDPWGAAELTPEQELVFLKAEAQQIRDALTAIDERVQAMQKEDV
ncbi:MAG: hypothetical protein JW742_01565 [Candidatus Aminicenantes bacterium]|nr:hypothetical protein [Candidatus Aminicenantes bacterium]